jgi:hypothetical protein
VMPSLPQRSAIGAPVPACRTRLGDLLISQAELVCMSLRLAFGRPLKPSRHGSTGSSRRGWRLNLGSM